MFSTNCTVLKTQGHLYIFHLTLIFYSRVQQRTSANNLIVTDLNTNPFYFLLFSFSSCYKIGATFMGFTWTQVNPKTDGLLMLLKEQMTTE